VRRWCVLYKVLFGPANLFSPEILAFLIGCALPSLYIAYTDAKSYTIYDKASLPIILAGLVNAIHAGSLPSALAGGTLGFGLMFVLAAAGGAGGGDVKYAAGLGLWLGFPDTVHALLIAAVIGAAWGALRLARAGILRERLKALAAGVYLRVFCGVKGAVPLQKIPDDPDAPLPAGVVPFGTCIAATVWAVWLQSLIFKGVV